MCAVLLFCILCKHWNHLYTKIQTASYHSSVLLDHVCLFSIELCWCYDDAFSFRLVFHFSLQTQWWAQPQLVCRFLTHFDTLCMALYLCTFKFSGELERNDNKEIDIEMECERHSWPCYMFAVIFLWTPRTQDDFISLAVAFSQQMSVDRWWRLKMTFNQKPKLFQMVRKRKELLSFDRPNICGDLHWNVKETNYMIFYGIPRNLCSSLIFTVKISI